MRIIRQLEGSSHLLGVPIMVAVFLIMSHCVYLIHYRKVAAVIPHATEGATQRVHFLVWN